MRVGSKIVLGAVVICALGLSISRTVTAQQTVVRGEEKNANVQIGILGDQPVDLINGLLVLQFQDEHRKADLANRFVDGFRKDKASGIPYGTYKARIYVNGFWGAAERTVEVYQPNVLVVLDMRIRKVTSTPIDSLELPLESPDWPRLQGPHCVRSVCYVDVMDML